MRLFYCSLVAVGMSACTQAESLPRLKLEPTVSVSGISSGAYMATQFHVAHSSKIQAVGLIAGGPYECAMGDLSIALARCVDKQDKPIDLVALKRLTETRADDGTVDSVENLKNGRIWIFHGSEDNRVSEKVTDASADFYRMFLPEESIKYEKSVAAAHAFPTAKLGAACAHYGSPFINNCNYDAAKIILENAYGSLNAASAPTDLMRFDQSQYASENGNTLANEGFVYIPKLCMDGQTCRVHVAFHGCQQNAENIAQQFVDGAGYNQWAESNRIVVLYPQTKASFVPLNPKACWDWWGYTDPNYATKNGQQIQHVSNMLKALGVNW